MALSPYFAHSGKQADRSDWQLLEDHTEAVAALARQRGTKFQLGAAAALAGRFHDFGKYDPAFDLVLEGKNLRVDHSTAGGWVLLQSSTGLQTLVAEILSYCILGHHAGLPDMTGDGQAGVRARVDSFRNPIATHHIQEAEFDLRPAMEEIFKKARPLSEGFDLALATRMIFSCLVDADFRDTESFYAALEHRDPPRDWPKLSRIIPQLIERFDAYMSGKSKEGELNALRASIAAHVRAGAAQPAGLFTLTVPTGGGKTLASLGFALEHARLHGQERIIYAIPYSSITEQTADIFRDIFPDLVLEHHSSLEENKHHPQQREKLRLAMEDWAAPLVVTTNVQFFESLFSARGSRARKLHNIANSVIILDESQCLSRDLLAPSLKMINALAVHYGCTIILCTATQPAFDSRQLGPNGLDLAERELAPEPERLAKVLKRAQIRHGGIMTDEALIAALEGTNQGFVIVNSRKHALNLFKAGKQARLEGLIHLTTRQYPAHRREIIAHITAQLKDSSLPPCRLIATSLIEAGVDLDFPLGWRAEAGLDSCVQAAGRVNREGKRPLETSLLTIFEPKDAVAPHTFTHLIAATRKTLSRFPDPLSLEAMRDWFNEIYWKLDTKVDAKGILGMTTAASTGTNFAFRKIANAYRMIQTDMVPIIIASDPTAAKLRDELLIEAIPSSAVARHLQHYIVQIPNSARMRLIECGHASFAAPQLRGDQFCFLDTESLYHQDSGLWWEDAEYLADEMSMI